MKKNISFDFDDTYIFLYAVWIQLLGEHVLYGINCSKQPIYNMHMEQILGSKAYIIHL